MFSGFQSNAFQSNAFQIVRGGSAPSTVLLGGGADVHHYHHPYAKYREEEYQRQIIATHKTELAIIDKELADTERLKAEHLAEQSANEQSLAFEAWLQQEISRLRIERIWLIQRIQEEESILLILLMMKRRRLRVV